MPLTNLTNLMTPAIFMALKATHYSTDAPPPNVIPPATQGVPSPSNCGKRKNNTTGRGGARKRQQQPASIVAAPTSAICGVGPSIRKSGGGGICVYSGDGWAAAGAPRADTRGAAGMTAGVLHMPPQALAVYPPIAILTNALLAALNGFRLLIRKSVTLLGDLANVLDASLAKAFGTLLEAPRLEAREAATALLVPFVRKGLIEGVYGSSVGDIYSSHIPNMHRYRIVAQISLILSILNLVLAAPVAVQEIHEARGDETVVAEDLVAMTKELGESEAASDKSSSPPPSPDELASPQHSLLSDGSASSGYPVPHLSSDESVSGYSWLLDRPPRLSPNLPGSSHEPASPHPSSSGSLASHPSSSGSLASHLSSLVLSHVSTPEWLRELLARLEESSPSPQHSGSLWAATTDSYSPPERFTPSSSHHTTSLSLTDSVSVSPLHPDGPMNTPYTSASSATPSSHHDAASDGLAPSHHDAASDGLAPSHNSISEESPSSPPENAKFLSESMMKKLKIAAGVTIIGSIIAGGIAGSRIKHRDFQDS
ncbi:hypothetical protein F5888DRAFT_1848287 [Russula emetica]|nr:hypothetical protein F5888DRAFT_1848287 [Russula emetica]